MARKRFFGDVKPRFLRNIRFPFAHRRRLFRVANGELFSVEQNSKQRTKLDFLAFVLVARNKVDANINSRLLFCLRIKADLKGRKILKRRRVAAENQCQTPSRNLLLPRNHFVRILPRCVIKFPPRMCLFSNALRRL